ncbi:MAG: DUF420 domain-containing protein [Bacteroidetes bacterium]|nr:DUF420 domain-containing protein [Bacteroidota bacterium]
MKFDVMMLPAVNATLNGIATVLLLVGRSLIRRRHVAQHRKVMITAFSVSVLFLISYLTYHGMRGGITTHFGGPGAIATIYYAMLISHVTLAACVPVLAIITMRRGLRMDVARHRKIARWTYPIWLYVSVTGVLVYFMLYQWFPSAP